MKQLSVIFALLVLALAVWNIIDTQKRYQEMQTQVENMVQERGISWHEANSAPDSIYFVNFNGDTTWYIKANKEAELIPTLFSLTERAGKDFPVIGAILNVVCGSFVDGSLIELLEVCQDFSRKRLIEMQGHKTNKTNL